WPLRCDLATFQTGRVDLQAIDGPTPRKLRDAPVMDFRGGRRVARKLDALLDGPQRWWIDRQTSRRQRQVLGGLDVLHASDVVQLAARGVGIVATVFDLSPLHFPDYHIGKNIEFFAHKMTYICAHADRVIAISQHTADDLVASYPTVAGRVDVVYCAADETMRPVTEPVLIERVLRHHHVPAAGYFLSVGTIEPRKNLGRLVEAYAQVRAMNGPETPPLVLVGDRGWRNQPIFDAVARLQLQEQVIFTGHVPDADLPALYSGACCLVYPSLFEGFGIPVLEAMTCGAPVIASNTSSLPEVAGEAALLVAPTDTDALAGALHRLLNDSGLRARLSGLGKAQAARFSWPATARQTYAVYRAAIQQKRGAR
ncbi:MAG: glycosyltransferase family 4 protein, partial [Chloroflexi bacterium]|nr:glycosyltransferase family 4 protein [Chloroflexota bacterium]